MKVLCRFLFISAHEPSSKSHWSALPSFFIDLLWFFGIHSYMLIFKGSSKMHSNKLVVYCFFSFELKHCLDQYIPPIRTLTSYNDSTYGLFLFWLFTSLCTFLSSFTSQAEHFIPLITITWTANFHYVTLIWHLLFSNALFFVLLLNMSHLPTKTVQKTYWRS